MVPDISSGVDKYLSPCNATAQPQTLFVAYLTSHSIFFVVKMKMIINSIFIAVDRKHDSKTVRNDEPLTFGPRLWQLGVSPTASCF